MCVVVAEFHKISSYKKLSQFASSAIAVDVDGAVWAHVQTSKWVEPKCG